MKRAFPRTIYAAAALWFASLANFTGANAATVTSVADTGTFNPDEMTIDRSTGDIFLTGFADGSSTLSVVKVAGGGITTLYSPLPGTTGGDLTYTNGFTNQSYLYWNNANSGSGSGGEMSIAPKDGSGPITRNATIDDLDTLSSNGTTLFAAYYTGALYQMSGDGTSGSFLGFHRNTSHLCIVANSGAIYVVDQSGAYRYNIAGNSFTDIVSSTSFRVGGSRLGEGGGFIYPLDLNLRNGFWFINENTSTATFVTDPSFTNLTSISYYNGAVYVADTGEASGATNTTGHVWKVTDFLPCTPAPVGLVGWWPGDGNTNDITAGAHNGSWEGNPAYTLGEVDQAFNFDGSSDVLLPAGFAPIGSAPRTIDFWFKTIYPNANHEMFSYGFASTHQLLGIDIDGSTGTGNLQLQVFTYGDDLNAIDTGVPPGQFMHVAVTYDGNVTLNVYVNGALKGTLTLSAPLDTVDSPISIGHFGGYFIGQIDEVEIFNRALDATEIAAIYNAGAGGKCKDQLCVTPPAGMIHWWPGDGNAKDIQGSNNGSLQNNAGFSAGEVGQAFSLNSAQSQYVDVGSLDLPGTFSIDAWINPADFNGNPAIISNYDNFPNGYQLYIPPNGSLDLLIGSSAGTTAYQSIATLTAGVWQHVVATYDGAAGAGQKVHFYVNGSPVAVTFIGSDKGGTPSPSTATATIGSRGTAGEYFNGGIDEVEIFDHVLSATEIGDIYRAGTAGKCKPEPTPQVPASVTINGGNNQQTEVNTQFPSDLSVVVKDSDGAVIANQLVTFAAPAAGASGTFSNSSTQISVNTDESGVASVSFTANGIAGNYQVTATAGSAFTSFSLANTCPTIDLSPSTLPNGTVGTAYNQSITASGGSGSYTFARTAGALPPGLALASDGTLSGTPTADGTFNFTVTATDSNNNCTGSWGYAVVIDPASTPTPTPCATITLSPNTLPSGTVGTSYNQVISASGGSGSYSFSVTAGALPPGLTLASDGTLSGTPTADGTFNFTVTASETNSGCTGSQAYTVVIGPASTPTPTPTATPTPTPIVNPTEVEGSGTIPGQGDQASFSMDLRLQKNKKKSLVVGSFSYSDPAAGVSFQSSKITTLTFSGRQAHFSGTAKLSKKNTLSFTVDVTDNGSSGSSTPDTLAIHVSNGYSANGDLSGGNITIY